MIELDMHDPLDRTVAAILQHAQTGEYPEWLYESDLGYPTLHRHLWRTAWSLTRACETMMAAMLVTVQQSVADANAAMHQLADAFAVYGGEHGAPRT